MDVFHINDKVFVDRNVTADYEYGRIIGMDILNNKMTISLIDDGYNITMNIDSPQVKKLDFFPNDNVVIHDLLKTYFNKWGIITGYDWKIDRYRVMVDDEPHWFAPFELIPFEKDNKDYNKMYDDTDDWSQHFVKTFSALSPIKVKLSSEGKRSYEYHFNIKPPVDKNGRTQFENLSQLMEIYDPTFIYNDKYLIDNDEVLVKVGD